MATSVLLEIPVERLIPLCPGSWSGPPVVTLPLSMKQAAKITFAKLKRQTLQSIIYTPEKKLHSSVST